LILEKFGSGTLIFDFKEVFTSYVNFCLTM